MSPTPSAPDTGPLATWPPRWSPRAVVFDCDGLLVDTESEWLATQARYLAAHHATIDEETRRSLTGRSIETVVRALSARTGQDPYAAADELMVLHREALTDAVAVLPGAVETVRAVAARVPVAIASNSPRDLLDDALEGLGIADVVLTAVSVDDVAEGKPAPDIYVEAARRLGAGVADTLAFEDSETGATAARAAGLPLIAVPSIPGQRPVADRTLASLEDTALHAWIRTWERAR
ncbi:HAD family hydrolase [Brachybacterium subflavum]|uniref:HAD family hydrolase n=1 Tax=Brachybacterium subflavum TaxID=2585206 RepID=UPI0012663ED2|nr:HAD family phosphatase [Brachybacterium subflavum]